ncbi:MAG: hypothetical protein AAF619_13685 [Pseudomonadota bacterium]
MAKKLLQLFGFIAIVIGFAIAAFAASMMSRTAADVLAAFSVFGVAATALISGALLLGAAQALTLLTEIRDSLRGRFPD